MLFNSPEFLLFLPIVFGLYWFVTQRSLKAQNLLLLVASYVFYGWWDWRFLGLIALSTIVDFLVGIRIEEAPDKARKKRWLWVSLAVNLGILGYFKYANFFIENWISAWDSPSASPCTPPPCRSSCPSASPSTPSRPSPTPSTSIGATSRPPGPRRLWRLRLLLPAARRGPIERATNLLPQITSPRKFTYEQGRDGMRLILWGMFKKVVVADSCAPYVDMCFDNPEAFSGSTLILGAILFSFQIYGDFSGYSDIAIGTAKLFGFELMTNFKFPYFSRDIAEFWRRWHISLSTWFRDYLYIPLGGRASPSPRPSATSSSSSSSPGSGTGPIGPSSSGAASTPCSSSRSSCAAPTGRTPRASSPKARWLPSPRELLQMGWTFTAVTIAWVFFRADSLEHAVTYLTHPFDNLIMAGSEELGLPFSPLDCLFLWTISFKNKRMPSGSTHVHCASSHTVLSAPSSHCDLEKQMPRSSTSNSDEIIRYQSHPFVDWSRFFWLLGWYQAISMPPEGDLVRTGFLITEKALQEP